MKEESIMKNNEEGYSLLDPRMREDDKGFCFMKFVLGFPPFPSLLIDRHHALT
jgi:hypothetical protein